MSALNPIYVVDYDSALCDALGFLLAHFGREVRSFKSSGEFLEVAFGLKPGPVLLELQMPDLEGLSVQKRLLEMGGRLPVIMMTGRGEISLAVQAMKAGAVDFLAKPIDTADFFAALDLAEARLDHAAAGTIQGIRARRRLKVLTLRELQVLNELARGSSNKTIASDFAISSRTVEVHRFNLMRKLGLDKFPDALRIAFAAGCPMPPSRIEGILLQQEGNSHSPGFFARHINAMKLPIRTIASSPIASK